MSTVIEEGEHRIDRASQRMLQGLVEFEVRTTSELCEVAELSQNNQVIYRMENHLKPAGLVEELERSSRWGSSSGARRFVLSRTGNLWIEEHEEEMGGVVTVEEMRVGVREAVETAESARSSVQNYRKKVSRLKGRVEEAEETAEDAKRAIEKEQSHDKIARDKAGEAWKQADSVSRDVNGLEGNLGALRSRVSDLEEENEKLEGRLEAIEKKLNEVIDTQNEIVRERSREGGFFAWLFGR